MRKSFFALIPLLLLILVPAPFLRPAVAANPAVVGVDLTHGEGTKYLAYIEGNVTTVSWKRIPGSALNSSVLENVDLLMIGQPVKPFTADELQTLKAWFSKGGKGVWAAADSDFGPGVDSINIVNSICETLGSKLRVDQVSIEDPVSGMKGAYRVPGVVDPDPGAENVKTGITKPVLYHGPAPAAYVKPDGTWDSLSKSKPDSVMRIVWTNNTKAKIVENSAPAGKAYVAGQEDRFVLLAAEKMTVAGRTGLVIASGESPYGDYEPTWASIYYGVPLDGQKFVTNMISWSTGLVTTVPVTTSATTSTTTSKPPTTVSTTTSTTTTAAPPAGFDLTLIAAVIVIILVVAAAAVLFLRRKK